VRLARSTKGVVLSLIVFCAILVSACGDVPSKTDAFEIVQRDVKEEATCTLPITVLSRLKMQHFSKAVCVPRDPTNSAQMDATVACLDSLVAIGATKRMPAAYMAEWPDELGGTAFNDVSPYERRARDLLFKGCVEQAGELREGGFRCGEAHADKVIRVSKSAEGRAGRALVRYSRVITLDPKLDAVEKACGEVSRPAPEATATFEKIDKKWQLAAPDGSPTSPSAASSASSTSPKH
jgi:hypothetical protein